MFLHSAAENLVLLLRQPKPLAQFSVVCSLLAGRAGLLAAAEVGGSYPVHQTGFADAEIGCDLLELNTRSTTPSTAESSARPLLQLYPSMPATVIAERIGVDWWPVVAVGERRADSAGVRPGGSGGPVGDLPGQQMQCDLMFPGRLVPDHGGGVASFPVLVMVTTYSRFIAAVMLPSRITGDLLAGMWQLISTSFGAVPRTLLWDNEAGIGRRGKPAQGVPGFCGAL